MDAHEYDVASEAEDASSSSDEENSSMNHNARRSFACAHSYLGEVDDITCRSVLLEEGALFTLPLFYMEGVVLFPGATLPLRIILSRFKAAVELAMHHQEAPCTFGVVLVHERSPRENTFEFTSVGTTAEIRQLRSLDDGSINIIARGCQRFRTVDVWTNADNVVCAQVQILGEDSALHIPRDAFGSLACVLNSQSGKDPSLVLKLDNKSLNSKVGGEDATSDIVMSPRRTHNKNVGKEKNSARQFQRQHSCERTSSRQERNDQGSAHSSPHGDTVHFLPSSCAHDENLSSFRKRWALDASKCLFRAQLGAWPHWVYRMFDAYDLARRAADLWTQVVELPSIYDIVRRPEMLSYHIASKMPVQDTTRQELLEIDGVVYRLQREILLLESMNNLKCKSCMTLIARRSDILVMSPEGPMDAYVNNYGIVHETLTLLQTQGLTLVGDEETKDSWFPGYSWTIAFCSVCKMHVGWLYKAVRKGMHPRLFWGVRRAQLAESTT